jgi:arylsulfatase A-like enzyme
MSKPNIIFLMADQHRWDALGCVNPTVKTPNLDALAARGVRFEQAICNVPMCVPSRYSMMTGVYGSQIGSRHNKQFAATDEVLPLPVIPERLRDFGYQTIGVGKTHWYIGSRHSDIETVPSKRGFELRAVISSGDPREREPDARIFGIDAEDQYKRLRAETESYGGGGESVAGYTGRTSAIPWEEHREGWLTAQALDFLENDRDSDRPLFFYFSLDFPHAGFNVPAGYEELYDLDDIPDRPFPDFAPDTHAFRRDEIVEEWQRRTPEERRMTTLRYYALCSFVDAIYGKVLDKLEAMGELDDALIVFTSDHGEMLGERYYRFSKYSLYDGSVRVPLIISGPRVPENLRGTVDQRPAELIDVLPTLLDATGQEIAPFLPGGSLLREPRRAGSFAEFHGGGYRSPQEAPAYMWRSDGWKLILHIPGLLRDAHLRLEEMEGELYHLDEDPYEWHNLYDHPEHFARRERMTRELLMYLACMWARYPKMTPATPLE